MLDFLLIVLFCILGVLVGVITGLLPGLHVNNVALIMLSASSSIIVICSPLFSYGISQSFILILIAGFMISVSISHSFHDTIPTTFIGAPEEDTALSVLPAHGLLLKGEGYKAVALSAVGSYGAILLCIILLLPLRFIIGPPFSLYTTLQDAMVWVLIAIALLMITTEKTRITELGEKGILPSVLGMLFAAFVFVLSGIFGLVILDFNLSSPIALPAPVLFPALAGLFGIPTLLNSFKTDHTRSESRTTHHELYRKKIIYCVDINREHCWDFCFNPTWSHRSNRNCTCDERASEVKPGTNHCYSFIGKYRSSVLCHSYAICDSSSAKWCCHRN
jgi:putative membrane protein